jgi:hypothetical protein
MDPEAMKRLFCFHWTKLMVLDRLINALDLFSVFGIYNE